MHERLREHSLAAWAAVAEGGPNPLAAALTDDAELLRFLPRERIARLMIAAGYVGDAPMRARALAARCRDRLRGGPVLP
jgi:adenylosuccinate lyase